MPTCYFCHTVYSDLKSLMLHLKYNHDLNSKSIYKCGELGCYRDFTSSNSFKKHFSKLHFDPFEKTVTEKENSIGNETKQLQCNSTYSEDILNDPLPSEQNKTKTKFDHFQNFSHFRRVLKNKASTFVAEFYATFTLNRKNIQTIIDSVNKLLDEPLSLFEKDILNVFSYSEDPGNIKYVILEYVSELKSIFRGLTSDYLRLKHLEESDYYIKPVEYITGERLDKISDGIGFPKTYTAQFIEINKVLKMFLELPSVYNDIVEYINLLKNQTEVSNIIQTDFWKCKVEKLKNIHNNVDQILPLFIYFDEYESGNPLGSHAGIHKLGTIYFSVACLPPLYQAHLENIFLGLLFHSSDLKEFNSDSIFSKLVDELIDLEENGICINTNEKVVKIRFCLALCLGDNLGLNTLMGFSESFRANYFCRFCKCTRLQTQDALIQRDNLLRKVDNYNEDIIKNNISETGIKEQCLFNKIPTFHAVENFSVDIAHDVFEGIAAFDLTELLHYYVFIRKYLSVDELNSCIKYFNFGQKDINKPPLISIENLRKKKINMSCAEMKCFVLYFGLMFGHKIPTNSEHWKLYIYLRKILQIILSSTVSLEKCNLLKKYVAEHHSLYKNLFQVSLKPKHHNLIHYPHIMAKVGPVKNLCTLRYESKHRQFKLYANTISSRVNITQTLAKRCQLQLCCKFIKMKGFHKEIVFQKENNCSQDINDIPNICSAFTGNELLLQKFKNCYVCDRVTIGNITYKTGDVIIVESILPLFGIICHILVDTENSIAFTYKQVKSIKFNDHYFSYEVEYTNILKIILESNLTFKEIVIINEINKRHYISLFI